MASSGSVDFSVSRDDIIQDAAENLGIVAEGGTPTAAQVTVLARKLNMIVKQWQGQADFSRGLKAWSRKRAYIFLQKGQGSYSLGPSGDHATGSYVTTTLTANSAISDTTIEVGSIAGISASDYVGVEMDDGSIHWTTVSGAPSGLTVTFSTGVTAAASSGNRMFAYTTKMRRPLGIVTAMLRDSSNNDTPMVPFLLENYEELPSKTADGTPSRYLYEAQLTNGVIYLDVEPSDVTHVIRIVYLSPIEDFDASTDTPDYPQSWFRALCAQLTMDGCLWIGKEVTQGMKLARDEAVAIAQNEFPETTDIYFAPGAD